MGFYDAIRVGASGAADSAFTVDRSLRFNDNDSPYLQRTPSSAGNRKTNTLSAWVKIGHAAIGCIASCYSSNSDSNNMSVLIWNTGEIRIVGYSNNFRITNRVLRDPSAWYHIVVAIDTTQASADDRIKLYINGVQETSFSINRTISQNDDLGFAQASTTRFGSQSNVVANLFDGYLAEVNFIDGQQLTPSSFGETDATTGQWNPIDTSGLTFGTTGFRLQFSDNSGTTATTLGKDSSGNSNNFTPNNFSVSAGAGNDSVEDTPTNNFCTLNPLAMIATGNVTPSNGNLDASFGTVSGGGGIASSFVVRTGKWYWETTITAVSGASIHIGILDENIAPFAGSPFYEPGVTAESYAYQNNGTKYNNNTNTSYGASYTTNDVIGIALDLDNGTITFYKNNVSQGQAFSSLTGGFSPAYGDGSSAGTHSISANFGQQGFTYTPPTDFKALNSANLPDPTILLPNKHFDTLLYTGNGGTQSITGLDFQPDWVWMKARDFNSDNAVVDSVRGRSKIFYPSANQQENTSASDRDLVSFDSNGFTLGAHDHTSSTNKSGVSIVAWNWNAGDTDGKTYTVKVVSDGGNKYRFDDFGTSAVTLDLAEGGTYIFDQSDSSNNGHPLRFSTTSNGTHGGGSEYTTGVTTSGTPGYSGAFTQIVVAASAPTLYYYCTNHSGMGGQANTNSTLGSSNFDGSIQSTVKVNASAGFSIVTYTGNGTGGATLGHGLSVTPQVTIIKDRTTDSRDFIVNHPNLTSGKVLFLNSTSAELTNGGGTPTTFTSTTIRLDSGSGGLLGINHSSDNYVMYCLSEVSSYSKFGSYVGNGSSDGVFVFTGFKPAFVITKNISSSYNWMIFDIKRSPFNDINDYLFGDLSEAEGTNSSSINVDFLSNGFKWRGSSSGNDYINKSGDTFIYLAFAESPFKNARAR